MAGESIEESLMREFKEEAGIEIRDPEKVGLLEFTFQNTGEIIEAHLYRASEYSGEPVETEEMRPEWFHIDEIPFTKMWPDDIYWMPLFLKGKKFRGKFLFGEGDQVLSHELEEVESIN